MSGTDAIDGALKQTAEATAAARADTRKLRPGRCPVCDAALPASLEARIVLRHIRGSRSWWRCDTCGSFFAGEPFDAEREVTHIRTRAWGRVETAVALGEAKGPLFESILRGLRTMVAPGARLLDIGCSYGSFLQRAKAAGYDVRGVDIVPEAVDYVQSTGIACQQAASVTDVEVPEASQDVITVVDCNCYWPDHRRELRAIRARLRPGGVLAMRVVDTSWAVRLGLMLEKLTPSIGRKLCERVVYDHHVSVPADALMRLLKEEGFTIVRTSVRDAAPFEHNTLKARVAYWIGDVVWRLAGRNVAPGLVVFARKELADAQLRS